MRTKLKLMHGENISRTSFNFLFFFENKGKRKMSLSKKPSCNELTEHAGWGVRGFLGN